MTRAQSRKHRGYKTQRNVAEYLRQWFPFAQGAGAGSQGTDVLNTPFDIEVKARDHVSIQAIHKQLHARKKEAISIGVVRLNGMGDDASQYVALMKLGDLCQIAFDSKMEPIVADAQASSLSKDKPAPSAKPEQRQKKLEIGLTNDLR